MLTEPTPKLALNSTLAMPLSLGARRLRVFSHVGPIPLGRGSQKNWGKLFWAFDGCVPEDKQLEADLHTKYIAMGLPLNVALTEAGYD